MYFSGGFESISINKGCLMRLVTIVGDRCARVFVCVFVCVE